VNPAVAGVAQHPQIAILLVRRLAVLHFQPYDSRSALHRDRRAARISNVDASSSSQNAWMSSWPTFGASYGEDE
jgi:hypothetical protein